VDPKFVDAAQGNFRLQNTSPAINAGVAISTVATDFAGVARPQQSKHDIGAFESTTGTVGLTSLRAGAQAQAASAAVQLHASGAATLRFRAEPGQAYVLEVSTDLKNWRSLGPVRSDQEGQVEGADPGAGEASARFYRLSPASDSQPEAAKY
jgi:hypothetical protein